MIHKVLVKALNSTGYSFVMLVFNQSTKLLDNGTTPPG